MKRPPLTDAQIEALATGSPAVLASPGYTGLDTEEALTSMAQEIQVLRVERHRLVRELFREQAIRAVYDLTVTPGQKMYIERGIKTLVDS